MKYILCELDDESYAHPEFSFHENYEKAQYKALDTILDVFKGSEGFNLQIQTEKPEATEREGVRISANWEAYKHMNYNEEPCFYVTEFFIIDESKGSHLLIWHHAYEGVGFEIRKQGTYEECLAEKRRQMKESCDSNEEPDNDVIDTGNEWEVWSIVEIK